MKKNSLTIRTLIDLSVFSVVILLLLWIIQIQFLKYFYEKYQIDNVTNVAKTIQSSSSISSEDLENLAFKSNLCIQYYHDNTIESYNIKDNNCVLGSDNRQVKEIKEKLITSDASYMKLMGPNGGRSVIYLVKSDDSLIYLNTSIEDLNSTTSVLRNQLIYITLLLILLSLIVSIFISKQVNKPILKLIDSAKELSKGNYKVKFDGGNVAELDELASVLTVAASEMDKTDELRRDLIANVSHDLKTPLTMIKAYAEKVRDLSYKDPEKRTKDLNVIIDESDRLNNLVNDLLELSKMQAHEDTITLVNYDLIDEINEVMRRYDVIKEKDNIKFEINMPNKAMVTADRSKIDQVLYNLINNAIEHTGEDLLVKIDVKEKRFTYLVEITNTGKGIPKDEIPLVWNRYYTKRKNHKRNNIGTGLGLSIVKGALEKHNFKYGVKSEENKYTTFYFEIDKVKENKNNTLIKVNK